MTLTGAERRNSACDRRCNAGHGLLRWRLKANSLLWNLKMAASNCDRDHTAARKKMRGNDRKNYLSEAHVSCLPDLWKQKRARSHGGLSWNARWGRHPRRIGKVEKFRHIRLGFIARRQVWQIEARLNEFEDRGVIHDRMGDKILFRERRYYDQRHAKTGVIVRARNIAGPLKPRSNIVRQHSRLGRHVIVKSAALVIGEDKNRVLPETAGHKRIDQGGNFF